MREACDPCILLRYARFGIDQDNADICTVYCGKSPDHRITLDDVFDLALLAHTGRLNDGERTGIILAKRVYCVSRGTGDIGHDGSLGNRKPVGQ